MNKKNIINQTVDYVKDRLKSESSGHDFWHIQRVRQMAIVLGKAEKADLFIVEMAALLHDIADRKLNNGDEKAGLKKVKAFLSTVVEDEVVVQTILSIIENYSYTAHLKNKIITLSLEGQIVQDADRLDAIGAIGIARAFAYGGHTGRMMHDPSISPRKNVSAKKYTSVPSPTINHFYEKLLLLKDLMNTKTAIKIAEGRHEFMKKYLELFHKEWEGVIY